MTAGFWIASRRTFLPLKTRAARSGLKAITAAMRRIEGSGWEKRRSGRIASGTKNLLAGKRADACNSLGRLRGRYILQRSIALIGVAPGGEGAAAIVVRVIASRIFSRHP